MLPMLETIRWLPTTEFAQAAGITPQAARKALRQALQGRPWRQRQLTVRRVLSPGGRAGLSYEVAVASLPDALAPAARRELPAGEPAPPVLRAKAEGQDARVLRRLEIIGPAADCQARSAERAEA